MKKTAFVLVLIIGVFSGASLASAQTFQSFYTYGTASSCVNLTQNLSFGSRGSEVTRLQTFLSNRNYPGGGTWMITGYFGAATRAAVRNFQQEMGLSQTGALDVSTREAVYHTSCGGSYGTNYTTNPYLYTNPSYTYPYSYTPTYTPSVCDTNYGFLNTTGWFQYQNCGPYAQGPVSISYLSPLSGGVGDTVTIYGNGFSQRGNTVYFGIGVISNLSSADGKSISFTVPSQLTGYGSQQVTIGTYNVSVRNGSGYTSGTLPFVVTSLGTSGRPSLTDVSGPTTLATSASGIWTMKVYNAGSSYLSVNVNWGDQSAYPYASASAAQTIYPQGQQTVTFSHAYATAGTYTITFTATNASGQSSMASVTVQVTGSTMPGGAPTISYLSPAFGPVGTMVTIYGNGFSQWGNTVRFGNGAITNVSSSGSTITFVVPSYLSPYCPQGYACAMYAQVVSPGVYPVSVINGNGQTSNSTTFTVQ
ncbi:hypothetical protein FJY93_01625 [Candidatus Kaiserbacteria bacterium]|nr:hypothetical protein [Candidatus Kaiserbacteria bacterium]